MSLGYAYEQSVRTPVERLQENDAIWSTTAEVNRGQQGGWLVTSARGGQYVCPENFAELVRPWPAVDKAKLSTWVTDQERLGVYFPIINQRIAIDLVQNRPLRFSSKVDRFFEYLSRRAYRVGEPIFPYSPALTPEIEAMQQTVMRWIEAVDETEMIGFLNALAADGLIDFSNSIHKLTGSGMMRLDALDQQGAATDQAFVAMWFGDEMDAVYKEGIVLGLADAGYRAFRIDQSEHANKIDDEIIAEIRRSRFVVADFTSGSVGEGAERAFIPRGGVYYEAGFAQGLGMPVIWTVRADQIDAVHFDTRQFNHIVWQTPEDLRERLARRVLAVVGGPSDTRTIVRG